MSRFISMQTTLSCKFHLVHVKATRPCHNLRTAMKTSDSGRQRISSSSVIPKQSSSCLVAMDLDKVREWTVEVSDANILPSRSVRNIRAMVNTAVTVEHCVYHIKKGYSLQLCSLSKIHKCLALEAAEKLTVLSLHQDWTI